MQPVTAFGLFLSLALGLVSLALLARAPQRDAAPGARWLPIALLLYNLWVAGFLASAPILAASTMPSAWSDLIQLGLIAIALAWLAAHVAWLNGLVPTVSARAARSLRRGFALVAGLLGVAWALSAVAGLRQPMLVIAFVARMAIFPVALLASVRFLRRATDVGDTAWRQRFIGLGWASAGLFLALAVLAITWSRLARIDPRLPAFIDVLLEFTYNGIAVAWVIGVARWPLQASAVATPAPPMPPTAVQASSASTLLAARGITKREAEIIELICQGKTNQEIADQLFISLTTVKDHNYVAFQKLGVRNRTELTRLVLGAGIPNQSRLLESRE